MRDVGTNRREVPYAARSPFAPLLLSQPPPVNLSDARLPEYIDVFELINGSIREAVPSAIGPARVFYPHAPVIHEESSLDRPLINEATHQLYTGLGTVFTTPDV